VSASVGSGWSSAASIRWFTASVGYTFYPLERMPVSWWMTYTSSGRRLMAVLLGLAIVCHETPGLLASITRVPAAGVPMM
jgi:hypothetical protein